MSYEALAPFYDVIHAEITDDVPFLLSLATQAGGPILELGCGSGRILLPLARAGFRLYGVDNSRAMLSQTATRAKNVAAEVTLVKADMAAFTLQTTNIALAIIGYNTFMHVPPAATVAVLRRVARHLAPNGLLVIDLSNPFAIARSPGDRAITFERTFTRPESGERVVQTSSSQVDAAKQCMSVIYYFDTIPLSGGSAQRTLAFFDYHYYYPHQIELDLRRAGFTLEEQFGNYDRQPFSETSDRLIVLARRSS